MTLLLRSHEYHVRTSSIKDPNLTMSRVQRPCSRIYYTRTSCLPLASVLLCVLWLHIIRSQIHKRKPIASAWTSWGACRTLLLGNSEGTARQKTESKIAIQNDSDLLSKQAGFKYVREAHPTTRNAVPFR